MVYYNSAKLKTQKLSEKKQSIKQTLCQLNRRAFTRNVFKPCRVKKLSRVEAEL